MKSLTCIKIDGGCNNLEVFPQGMLPNTLTYLCIRNLPNLINLGEGLHSLTSLKKLKIKHCKKLNKLMPKKEFPLKLQSLFITDCESILPSTEWGLHGMKSLAHFMIAGGCSTNNVRWSCFLKGDCCQTVPFLFESADCQISNTWSMGFSTSHRSKSWRSTVVRSLS